MSGNPFELVTAQSNPRNLVARVQKMLQDADKGQISVAKFRSMADLEKFELALFCAMFEVRLPENNDELIAIIPKLGLRGELHPINF